jgi:hypothetical protein
MSLGAFGLTTNGTASDLTILGAATTACNAIVGLTAMQALTVTLDFRYGSGGTTTRAYIQVSVDGGNSWMDIACWSVATTPVKKVWNFSALTPVNAVTPTDGAMSDNTVQDGMLGDRVRVKVITTGTYAGATTLVGRMVAH